MSKNMEKLKALSKKDEEIAQAKENLGKIKSQGDALIVNFLKLGQSKEQLINAGFDKNEVEKLIIENERIKNKEKEQEEIKNKAKENREADKEIKIQAVKQEALQIGKESKEAARMAEIQKRAMQIGAHEALLEDKFQKLSHGEKLLVMEQLSQNTLLHVKDFGEKKFQEKMSGMKWYSPKRAWKSLTKDAWIREEEKKVLKENREGKVPLDKDTFETIVNNISEMNLNVAEENGKPYINFATVEDSMPQELKDAANKYNDHANAFAHIPKAWGNKNFKRVEYEAYQRANESYEKARDAYTKKQAELGGIGKAIVSTFSEDAKVYALQAKIENKDAFDALDSIEREFSTGRLLNNKTAWKGFYMGAGYLTRKYVTGGLGFANAPIVGAAIGAIRGWRKGEQKLEKAYETGQESSTFIERKKAGEIKEEREEQTLWDKTKRVVGGREFEGKEIGAFTDADSQVQRLENLVKTLDSANESGVVNKIKGADRNRTKEEIAEEIKARVGFITDKKEKGLLNFGTENPAALEYKLWMLVSEAAVKISMNEPIDEKDRKQTMVALIQEHAQKKFNKNIINIRIEEITRGIAMGATFATAGALIKDWFPESWKEAISGEIYKGIHGVKELFTHDDIAQTVQSVINANKNILTNTNDPVEKFKTIYVALVNTGMNPEQALKECQGGGFLNGDIEHLSAVGGGNLQEHIQHAWPDSKTVEAPKANTERVFEKMAKDIGSTVKENNVDLTQVGTNGNNNSVTAIFARQIEAMTKNEETAKTLGFHGGNLHKFAIKKAAELARESGYIKPDGSDVRLGAGAIGHASYEVKLDPTTGKLVSHEYFDGKEQTAGSVQNKYEYSHEHNAQVKTPTQTTEEVTKTSNGNNPTNIPEKPNENLNPEGKTLKEITPSDKGLETKNPNIIPNPIANPEQTINTEEFGNTIGNIPRSDYEIEIVKHLRDYEGYSWPSLADKRTDLWIWEHFGKFIREGSDGHYNLKFLDPEKGNPLWATIIKSKIPAEQVMNGTSSDKFYSATTELQKLYNYVYKVTGNNIEPDKNEGVEKYVNDLMKSLEKAGKLPPVAGDIK